MDENNESQADEGLTNESEGTPDEGGSKGEPKGEETVSLKKAEYEKLLSERDNYKKGMLAAKGHASKKEDAPPPKKESDAVSRDEFVGYIESQALEDLTTIRGDDSASLKSIRAEIKEHFNDIIKHIPGTINRMKIIDFKEGMLDAHAVWKRRNENAPKKNEENTELKAKLGEFHGTGGKTLPPYAERKNNKFEKFVRGTSMKDWFPKKES